MRFTAKVLLTVPVLLLLSANASTEIQGEIIAAYDTSSGLTATMSATNGSGFTATSCGGDLTHLGSPRYFLEARGAANVLPDGYYDNELVVADEACTDARVITNTPTLRFGDIAYWSPDGSRIAAFGANFDLSLGDIVSQGIYLADLRRDDPANPGRPTGIENLRLIVATTGDVNLSWSGDSSRIAYAGPAPDGKGGWQQDIFVYDLISGASFNITNTPDAPEGTPAYSPVDGRVAFNRLVATRGNLRYDIFTVPDSGGYEVQVTTKSTTSATQNWNPSFSPDGQYISFAAGDWFKGFDIYRVKSNGSGKATNLTNKRPGSYRFNVWRR
jgi:hypothetical protein